MKRKPGGSGVDETADDPGGLIRSAIEMGPEFPGPAEDLLLAWILKLSADADVPSVARRLIERYALAETPREGEIGRLIGLIREAASSTGSGPGVRRGGRTRRPE
jgi:hypothetical protein